MAAARRAIEDESSDDWQQLKTKTDLVRRLLERGVDKSKVQKLIDFIKYYVRFDRDVFLYKFEKNLEDIDKTAATMGIREAILNEVREASFEKGLDTKLRTVVIKAGKKGMSLPEIVDLVDEPVEKVEEIIQSIEEEK